MQTPYPEPAVTGRDPHPVAIVVDDDHDQRDLIGAILEESDVEVIECESGEDAMRVMEEVADRTIFMFADIRLGGRMDGAALARQVGDRWPHIRLVTTSGKEEAARVKALPRGTRFFPKPWRPLDVIIALEQAIEERSAA